MPSRPAPSEATTASVAGGPSPRAATKTAMTASDVRYIPQSTTGTGNVRLFRPPRKSASPQSTEELSASAIAATGAGQPRCRAGSAAPAAAVDEPQPAEEGLRDERLVREHV